MTAEHELKVIHTGKHVSLITRGNWEYVTRNNNRPVVSIVALTDSGEVLLVEQFRPPVGENVIELPAGLAGDIPGLEQESLLEAAQRELLEETGYTASNWTELCSGYSSPGLTDESTLLFLAVGLEKQHDGGGDESENITVHKVLLESVYQWLREQNKQIDLKLLAGLFAAEEYLNASEPEK